MERICTRAVRKERGRLRALETKLIPLGGRWNAVPRQLHRATRLSSFYSPVVPLSRRSSRLKAKDSTWAITTSERIRAKAATLGEQRRGIVAARFKRRHRASGWRGLMDPRENRKGRGPEIARLLPGAVNPSLFVWFWRGTAMLPSYPRSPKSSPCALLLEHSFMTRHKNPHQPAIFDTRRGSSTSVARFQKPVAQTREAKGINCTAPKYKLNVLNQNYRFFGLTKSNLREDSRVTTIKASDCYDFFRKLLIIIYIKNK